MNYYEGQTIQRRTKVRQSASTLLDGRAAQHSSLDTFSPFLARSRRFSSQAEPGSAKTRHTPRLSLQRSLQRRLLRTVSKVPRIQGTGEFADPSSNHLSLNTISRLAFKTSPSMSILHRSIQPHQILPRYRRLTPLSRTQKSRPTANVAN